MYHLNLILLAALDAGKAIVKIYRTEDFGIDMKSDFSPLTKADLASNEIITKALSSTGIPVLSEEGRSISFDERKNWDQLWIVDPLDGTKEFIKKNGEFTVNIALVEKGIPILGVVFAPALNEIYFGSKELGSFKAITADNSTTDEIISSAQKLPFESIDSTFRIVASRSHMSAETEEFIAQQRSIHGQVETISRGSSLKLCMVAEGIANCYPRFAPTMEWDTAAGQAICMFSGAQVINWETQEPMSYNKENLLNNWFLVKR
jgi:3'(2'), 5'-bisphosphate nucleotidase